MKISFTTSFLFRIIQVIAKNCKLFTSLMQTKAPDQPRKHSPGAFQQASILQLLNKSSLLPCYFFFFFPSAVTLENHNPGCLPYCMLLKTSFRLIFAKVVSNVGWKRERGHAVAGRARWYQHQLSCCCEPLPGTRVCTHTCAPCTHVPERKQLPPGAPPAFHSHFVPPSLPISGFHHQDPKKCFREESITHVSQV